MSIRSQITGSYILYLKEKWAHAGFQKYLKNTGWMFLGHSTTLISLAVNIWLARYLGPQNFGILSYVISFVGIFSFLAGLGISTVLVRDLVKKPEKRDELLGTTFWLLLMSGLVSTLLVSIFAFIFEGNILIRGLIIFYSCVFLFNPTGVVAYYFQATIQAKKNAIIQIIGVISVALIKAYLILSDKGVIWITSTFVLDYMIGSILCVLMYKRSGFSIRAWKFNKTIAKNLLYSSWFLMLSSAATYILMRIDQVMVKQYLGEISVGIYAVAVRLSEIWYFIPGLICASFFPAIINAKMVNEEMYLKRLKKLYLLLGGTAIFIAIPITLLAPWIISILYGVEYSSSVSILQIYVWSGIGSFLSLAITQYFTAENRLRSIFYYNLSAVIINVGLNLILIPKIGLTGAAWATLISYSIVPIVFFTTKRFESIPKDKIESKKISVIVRGLIIGNNETDERKKFTKRSLQSVRKYLPEAQIILSTWKGSDVSNLDYDILVLSDEPKRIDMAFADGDTKAMTVNNQIISSFGGLEKADREYSLVMRSDIVLTGAGFLKYFKIYNRSKDDSILEKRIVTLPTYNPHKITKLLFNVCDWFYFGLTNDIKKIFNIPLMDENKLSGEKINDHYLIKNNFESEQYIWINFLKKYKNIYFPYYDYFTEQAVESSEESYARHTIMIPANKANIICLKMPKAGYGAIPYLSQGLYTLNEYKKLYNKYNVSKILIIPNPIEKLLYCMVYNTRQLVKKYTPSLHKKIINTIRRCNGSYNLLK